MVATNVAEKWSESRTLKIVATVAEGLVAICVFTVPLSKWMLGLNRETVLSSSLFWLDNYKELIAEAARQFFSPDSTSQRLRMNAAQRYWFVTGSWTTSSTSYILSFWDSCCYTRPASSGQGGPVLCKAYGCGNCFCIIPLIGIIVLPRFWGCTTAHSCLKLWLPLN